MKFFFLLLASFISLQNLQAHINQQNLTHTDKIKLAQLHGSYKIKITKEKLFYANQESFDHHQLSLSLKKFYAEFSPILLNFNESEWIEKTTQEILALQKNHEARNCFNQAFISLKKVKDTCLQSEKNQLLQEFYKNLELCFEQYKKMINPDKNL